MTSCDIIIPVWNMLAATKDCIDSVIKNTSSFFRIIIIDNASNDDTRRYLEGLKAMKSPPIIVVRNEKNVGFVKAANQGIRLSNGPCVCILNNDTIVTKDWLDEMMKVADSEKDIGIVNPSSNNLGQHPEKGEPLELYTERLKRDSGIFVELGAAIGFCMLIKKEVIERIGLFDEIYGMGNFEDTDFSRRAVKEGYRCVRACGSYVYHREGASFDRVKAFENDFKRNRQIFEFRWGRPKRMAYILSAYDDFVLKRLQAESLKLARGGNWVWYYTKGDSVVSPRHSNIITQALPLKNFYLNVVIKILTKKKKFDEIFIGEESLGKVLERLSFIHKARISYY